MILFQTKRIFEFWVTIAHTNTIVVPLKYRKVIRTIAEIEDWLPKAIISCTLENQLNHKSLPKK